MTTQQSNDTPNEQRSQLVLDITPALQRRIERAAARGDLSAAEYAERLLEQTVPDEEEQMEAARQAVTAEYLDRLREFQEQWAKNHPGVVFEDSAETVRKMREERSDYLTNL
ncbi:MAG TPA: hypothetical protein VF116_23795 [Ktedonobacterales bacterium]